MNIALKLNRRGAKGTFRRDLVSDGAAAGSACLMGIPTEDGRRVITDGEVCPGSVGRACWASLEQPLGHMPDRRKPK